MARQVHRLERAAEWSDRAVAQLVACIEVLEGLVDHRTVSAEASALVERVNGLCRHLSETAGGLRWAPIQGSLHAALPMPVAVVVTASLLNRLLLRVRSRAVVGLNCDIRPSGDELVIECRSPVLEADDAEALGADVISMAGQMALSRRVGVSGGDGLLRIHLPRAH